jgi:glycosyltransferase involved in cell wall biosynthesis
MNNIELSFCIPTYNRAQTVHRLVTGILSCEARDIEVVVLDNGSTDATLEILRTIKDERLQVYSNGENKGALFNMVNVLDKGCGNFLVYSTDQDHVDNTKIIEFKTFLAQHPDLAGGFCTFNSTDEAGYEILPKGYQAIARIAYQGRHPTGYFFNNKLLKSIRLVERFSDYDFVDLFPLEFAFAELCLMGNGAIYHRPIFTPETGAMVVKHKSATTNGKSKKAFFSPEARLKLAINYTRHIRTLQLASREKYLLMIDTFIHELVAATVGYKSILGNRDLCIHYGMECRNIRTKELFLIGLNFYKGFAKGTIDILGNNFIQQIKFMAHVLLKLFQKMVCRGRRIFLKEA